MEVKCRTCGHQMKLIEQRIKKAGNGRCYIETTYACDFMDCLSEGCGVYIQETLHGVDNYSEFIVENLEV